MQEKMQLKNVQISGYLSRPQWVEGCYVLRRACWNCNKSVCILLIDILKWWTLPYRDNLIASDMPGMSGNEVSEDACHPVWYWRRNAIHSLQDLCYSVLSHNDNACLMSNGIKLITIPYWLIDSFAPWNVAVILTVYFPNTCYGLSSWAFLVRLLSGEIHETSLMSSQFWFR